MSDRLTPVPNPHGSQLSARPVSRTEVVDAAARVITRRGDHRVFDRLLPHPTRANGLRTLKGGEHA